MRTRILMNKKSQGERGQAGYYKAYEITVQDNIVILAWGKAEEAKRQTKREFFTDYIWALRFAEEKMWEKIDKGYEVFLRQEF